MQSRSVWKGGGAGYLLVPVDEDCDREKAPKQQSHFNKSMTTTSKKLEEKPGNGIKKNSGDR